VARAGETGSFPCLGVGLFAAGSSRASLLLLLPLSCRVPFVALRQVSLRLTCRNERFVSERIH
jgi:hypothetical protein